MSKIYGNQKIVKIVYYSGTGCTERVAFSFKKALCEAGYKVCIQSLAAGFISNETKHDLLLLLYAVHACNAPEPVYKWIENSRKVIDVPAVVISVSGGGEVSPNTACRISCIKRLEKKGYKVTYEKMIVMPSNWIVSTKNPLSLMLLEVLPKKVHKIVSEISNNNILRTKPLLIDRMFSKFGELEKGGARYIGKRIKISDTCSGCGLCSKNCPAGNITMYNSKPQFGGGCNLCLRCLYGCPNKSLKPGFGKLIIIKEGFDLNELEKMLPFTEKVDVKKVAKGYLWSGVRKYLLEE